MQKITYINPIMLAVLLGFCCINFASPGSFQYNILILAICLMLLIVSYVQIPRISIFELSLIVIVLMSFYRFVQIQSLTILIEDSCFFMGLLLGARLHNLSKASKALVISFIFKFVNWTTLFTFFLFILGLQSLLNYFLIRSFGFVGSRGAPGFFGEPSYLIIAYLSIIIMSYTNGDYRVVKKDLMLKTGPAVLSFSSLLVVLYALNLISQRKILLYILTLLSLLFITLTYFVNFRLINTIIVAYDFFSGHPIIDISLLSRFFYIAKDCAITLNNNFMVYGLGSYASLQDPTVFQHLIPEKFKYNELLSGSLLGRYFVELGGVTVLAIIMFLARSLRVNLRTFFVSLVIVIVGFQMISTAFLPLSISLGFYTKGLLQR